MSFLTQLGMKGFLLRLNSSLGEFLNHSGKNNFGDISAMCTDTQSTQKGKRHEGMTAAICVSTVYSAPYRIQRWKATQGSLLLREFLNHHFANRDPKLKK